MPKIGRIDLLDAGDTDQPALSRGATESKNLIILIYLFRVFRVFRGSILYSYEREAPASSSCFSITMLLTLR